MNFTIGVALRSVSTDNVWIKIYPGGHLIFTADYPGLDNYKIYMSDTNISFLSNVVNWIDLNA